MLMQISLTSEWESHATYFYPMTPSIRNRSRDCKEILLLFCVFFLPGILFGHSPPDAFERLWWHAAVLVAGLPQIALLLFILELHPDYDPHPFGLRPLRTADLPAAGAVTAAMIAAVALLGGVVALIPGAPQAVAGEFRWRFGRPELMPVVLLTSIATGYREELFFRSYLLTRLERLGAPRPHAIALSTLLFASGHRHQGWSGMAAAALLGVVLALLFLRRRNLHAIALGHGLYNTLALAAGMVLRAPGATG